VIQYIDAEELAEVEEGAMLVSEASQAVRRPELS
jgi:hypothetical protein